jgi:hypothetical protein
MYTESKAIQGIGAILSIGPRTDVGGSPNWTPIFEITDMPMKAGEWDKLEVTNFNSPNNGKEYRKGLVDGGTASLSGNTVTDDPGQIEMAAAYRDKQGAYLFKIDMPKAIGQETQGDSYAFSALVMSWGPLSDLAPAKTVSFKADLQVTGGDPVKTLGS